MTTWRDTFEKLKADAKVKHYDHEPTGYAEYAGYLCTYCLEQTPFRRQPTLAISRLDRQPFPTLEESVVATVDAVFGPPTLIHLKVYPKRGETWHFIW